MPTSLDRAITLLTDGQPVDWEGVLEDAADPRERSLIEELRGLAQLDSEQPDPAVPSLNDLLGATTSEQSVGTESWGHLELLDQIGRGTFGTVHRAWDTRLAREVALKLIDDREGGGSLEEGRRLARVSHPNVVSVHGADRIGGQLGLWMELLKGRTLDAIVRDQGSFSTREAIAIGLDICSAVAAIHATGLIHRDIKAQNVMREPGGRLVLMDLGASIDVSQSDRPVKSLAGTPLYMAPELFDEREASVATDIYAIGVLLYRLVTAEFPIQARTIGDVRRAHASAALRPLREVRPDVTSGYVKVVERCLEHEPGTRFQSVAALERALHQIDAGRHTSPLSAVGAVGWTVTTAVLVAALVWAMPRSPRGSGSTGNASTIPGGAPISPEQYRVFSGFEELAFNTLPTDPEGSASATNGAIAQIRPAMPGNRPLLALLDARLAQSWRQAGDSNQSAAAALDAAAHMFATVGDLHPYAAVVAMQLACNAQLAGDHDKAAAEILRALEIRRRVLGLPESEKTSGPVLSTAALAGSSRLIRCDVDDNADGVLDVIASAAGLDARAVGPGKTTAIREEDRPLLDVRTRLTLGLMPDPHLTWAHYGAYEPRYVGWQTPARFRMIERADNATLPAWSVVAPDSQGYFTQRLSRSHSVRALSSGFSLLVRVMPVAGVASIVVDAAPAGPRFDLAITRVSDRRIQVRLLSKVIPQEGAMVTIDTPVDAPPPLLELRYRPQSKSAALYADGRLLQTGYGGHREFQDPLEGAITWGIIGSGGGDPKSAAAFNLVWLQVFGPRSEVR
jgi:serine/threonine-protein kinase